LPVASGILTDEVVGSLLVPELKEWLKALGLPVTGKKADLADRLRASVNAEGTRNRAAQSSTGEDDEFVFGDESGGRARDGGLKPLLPAPPQQQGVASLEAAAAAGSKSVAVETELVGLLRSTVAAWGYGEGISSRQLGRSKRRLR
jgi:hypothetical protein